MKAEAQIQKHLFELQDLKYKEFHCRLMPTVEKENVIGVRTPALRNYAKELSGTKEADTFLQILPHQYYDENNLHGFLIDRMKDYDVCIAHTKRFLPYVDNWATCDLMSPKVFRKHLPQLLDEIRIWIKSERVYTVRFGIGMLMRYFLDEAYLPEYPEMVAAVHSEEYYINMMIAWYFATALAKQYDSVLPYIEEQKLDKWCHNKTIQKAIESNRITKEQKVYLKTLKM